MNPPSALHSAMSRDRKPFTYTPGGLDLSEIKSERMAKRLMRNAMNQGVPETPVHPVHSQTNTAAPVALPNYNCLPVQVFPTFNLPANPKSILRTRSDPRETPIQRIQPSTVNTTKFDSNDTFNNNNKYTPTYSQVNNNRPVSMFEYSAPPQPAPVNSYSLPRANYGSDGYTAPLLPEISYEAEYFRTPPKVYSAPEQLPKLGLSAEKDKLPTNESVESSLDLTIKPLAEVTIPTIVPISEIAKEVIIPNVASTPVEAKDVIIPTVVPVPIKSNDVIIPTIDPVPTESNDVIIPNIVPTAIETKEVSIPTIYPTSVVTKPVEENAGTENEQREVKTVKKVKKENKVEEQNGNQNGDANVEAEMTVKLPTKKSAAKTETNVEVVKKVLPDGSIEEVKTTTTKTTIDGRTEIRTKTETTIIPKEVESEEEVVEEEEEEGEVEEVQEEEPETKTVTTTVTKPKENGQESKVVKTEERSESTTTTTKKVVVVQDSPKEEQSVSTSVEEQQEQEEEEEEEEVEEAEPVTVVVKKQATPEPPVVESKPVEQEEEEEEEEEEEIEEEKPAPKEVKKEEPKEEEVEEDEEEEEVVEVKKEEVKAPPPKDEEEEEEEEEEEYEEAEEKQETKVEVKTETKETKEEEEEEEEVEEEEKEEKKTVSEPAEEPKETPKEPEEKVIKVEIVPPKDEKPEPAPQTEYNIPIREPSIPLEKVEDVEIKPIGSSPIISKTHTENTEIITSTIDPSGGLTRQTEYNKIENIVTVNRTTKILDHNYENLTQQGIPTVRTYFPPPSIDRISTSPLPSRPYQPVYPPAATTERRHSLLLERLSTERQMPSEIYQYGNQNNQSFDQQYQEPRAEVLTVSNVKPSSITSDQQWYQKTNQQNLIYNNVSSTPTPTGQPWAQPKSQPQQQPQYQQQYQPPTQQYQPSPTPQPQYQPSPTPQPQYQPSPTPQYQHSYSEPAPERAPLNYTYAPPPTWATNTDSQQTTKQSNQYSSDNFKSTQQYSSSYVPPPWEQDSSYTSVNNTSQKYYAPAPLPETQTYSPAPTSGWKPPPAKFSKNAPISYIPPAPNQSFVRSASVSEPPRTPGRKTYYSEYERRYITVPESTYIPTETKYQPQPDPSPQYYYDNNEPSEEVEPQWRRELREFTEKTSQTTTTTTTEQTNVQPPWEAEANYPKNPTVQYTPTPTWSQTLRPRSFRERSFESEYVSQEWPKTNTLGRGRPLSSVGKVETIPERTRGVSVDRYNPVSYHSPVEQPPVQAHTLTTPIPHGGYHNPNVPAYHARASAEPREQPTSYQPRVYRESRASPLQSRSFKYLQWITGTEN